MAGLELKSSRQDLAAVFGSHSPHIHVLLTASLVVVDVYSAIERLFLEGMFQGALLIAALDEVKYWTGGANGMAFPAWVVDFKTFHRAACKALRDRPLVEEIGKIRFSCPILNCIPIALAFPSRVAT